MSLMLISAVLFAAVANPPTKGSKAPDFELRTPQGESVRLSELVADGPVVLVVLRGWTGTGSQCPACTAQVADLMVHRQKIAEHAKHVVMVYPGPSRGLGDHVGNFVEVSVPEPLETPELPKPLTLVLDPDYKMITSYGLRWDAPMETAYPSTLVIDGEGVVRWTKVSRTHKGRATAEEILSALKSL